MPQPVFLADSLFYSYNDVPAVRGVSFAVKPGERLALLGANGSGKSTLLRLLAALAFAHSGSLTFDGVALTPDRLEEAEFFYRFRRRVGFVFQDPDVQLFNASVFDEVAFGPLQLGWPRSDIRRRVTDMLSSLGIESLAARPPHRLSGGEKKRVALASVLVTDPEILLLDEPTGALDPASQTGILHLLSSWSGTSRIVITATHDLNALETIADRCLVLDAGRIAADTGPLTVLHDAALLERTGLLRPHRHTHDAPPALPHGHLHATDLK